MSDPANRSVARSWMEQGSGALLWGIFFIVVPFDFLLVGAILWLPLLICYEWSRAHRYGFFPGFLLDLGLVLLMGIAAVAAPVKEEDRRMVPVPASPVPLSHLGRVRPFRWDSSVAGMIKLPSRTPTLREITQAIESQTAYRCRIGRCGNGMTLLFGGAIMGIGLEPK